MKTEKPGEQEKLLSFYQAALKNRLAAAFWKLPGEKNIQALAGQASKITLRAVQLNSKGFAFAPFDTEKEGLFFIHPLFIYEGNPIPGTGQILPWFSSRNNVADECAGKAAYEKLVKKGISEIKKGELDKVVLSRKQLMELPADFSPVAYLHQISAEYPEAFTSLVIIPGVGTWIGATPELLLEVQKDRLRTVALAATQPAGENVRPWTEKELEEQDFVKKYIAALFREIGSGRPQESSLDNIRAGKLLHLYTEFTLKESPAKIASLAPKLLQKLHPTPAVAGLPEDRAAKFIRENEGYDRQFYSGYLGPVNIAKTTQLFVNLRCMQLLETNALLYAGAGITADSVPEMEWEETVQKMQTLLSVL